MLEVRDDSRGEQKLDEFGRGALGLRPRVGLADQEEIEPQITLSTQRGGVALQVQGHASVEQVNRVFPGRKHIVSNHHEMLL